MHTRHNLLIASQLISARALYGPAKIAGNLSDDFTLERICRHGQAITIHAERSRDSWPLRYFFWHGLTSARRPPPPQPLVRRTRTYRSALFGSLSTERRRIPSFRS